MDAPTEITQLKAQQEVLVQALKGVIQSAAHPQVAIRVVMVDLKPVRAALKEVIGPTPELGIH